MKYLKTTAAALVIAAGVTVAALSGGGAAGKARPGGKVVSWHVFKAGECKATDGDTVRCGKERVRLVEIDAPEMPGHCAKTRVCAPGDPLASKAMVQRQVSTAAVRLERYGKDKYGRTLGDIRINGTSLSCTQIKGGYAIRQLKWKDYGLTTAECP